jgi:hypothetical protein
MLGAANPTVTLRYDSLFALCPAAPSSADTTIADTKNNGPGCRSAISACRRLNAAPVPVPIFTRGHANVSAAALTSLLAPKLACKPIAEAESVVEHPAPSFDASPHGVHVEHKFCCNADERCCTHACPTCSNRPFDNRYRFCVTTGCAAVTASKLAGEPPRLQNVTPSEYAFGLPALTYAVDEEMSPTIRSTPCARAAPPAQIAPYAAASTGPALTMVMSVCITRF